MTTSLINMYRQAEDYFFRGISLKYLDLGEGANAYMTGIPIADLNLIYVTHKTNILDKILNQGEQFYAEDNLSFVIIIPQEFCTTEIENTLNTRGYSQSGKSVSMAVKLESFKTHNNVNFDDGTIIQANDDKLNDWMSPLIGAFESNFEISSHYARLHEIAMKKLELHHFSLYKQGKPIASITLSIHNSLARIDDVGTLPEFQGKGYATRLMTYVLSKAKELGATHCFLESSDSGLSIYQKLGFEALFQNNIYSKNF